MVARHLVQKCKKYKNQDQTLGGDMFGRRIVDYSSTKVYAVNLMVVRNFFADFLTVLHGKQILEKALEQGLVQRLFFLAGAVLPTPGRPRGKKDCTQSLFQRSFFKKRLPYFKGW